MKRGARTKQGCMHFNYMLVKHLVWPSITIYSITRLKITTRSHYLMRSGTNFIVQHSNNNKSENMFVLNLLDPAARQGSVNLYCAIRLTTPILGRIPGEIGGRRSTSSISTLVTDQDAASLIFILNVPSRKKSLTAP